MIGRLRKTRLACGREHLPGVYNPHLDLTACICGKGCWEGQVGTWHSRPLRRQVGVSGPNDRAVYEVTGWDTYYMHADSCEHRQRKAACRPQCGEAEFGDWPWARMREAAS